jgi:pimeloyl-ACP methyl ester carboxylesterase
VQPATTDSLGSAVRVSPVHLQREPADLARELVDRAAHPDLGAVQVREADGAATWSLSFSSTDVDPALGRYVDAMIGGTPVDVIAELYPAIAGLDASGAIEPLRRVPTLVLTGDADKMIPKAHSEALVARLPDAAFDVVPGAGHLVLLEKPDQVTAALADLVRRVAAQGAARVRGTG